MASSQPKRVCWDACAWIALIQKERILDEQTGRVTEDRYQMCRAISDAAESKGQIEIVTSGLSLAEVNRNPPDAPDTSDPIAAFFENEWVIVAPVDKLIGTTARRLIRQCRVALKPQDAVHLATAIVANVDEFHTFDGRLLDLDETLSRSDGNVLKICKPDTGGQPLPLMEVGKTNDEEAASGDQVEDRTEPEFDATGEVPESGDGSGMQSEQGGVRNDPKGDGAEQIVDEPEVEDDELTDQILAELSDENPQVAGSNPATSTDADGGVVQRESGGLTSQDEDKPEATALDETAPSPEPDKQ